MADDIIEGTHPTRMELLRIKDRMSLASKGHRLLKEKRDTLLMEFMDRAREASDVSDAAVNQVQAARRAQAISAAVAGTDHLEHLSIASPPRLEADVEYDNVMGLKLPTISLEERLNQIDARSYGLIATHPSVDTVAREYGSTVERLLELTQTESSLTRLSTEVKKTNRRVNALEYRVIPRLENTGKYIRMRLDELEREGFYRNKMVKKKRQQR